jgi:hypothetical protein
MSEATPSVTSRNSSMARCMLAGAFGDRRLERLLAIAQVDEHRLQSVAQAVELGRAARRRKRDAALATAYVACDRGPVLHRLRHAARQDGSGERGNGDRLAGGDQQQGWPGRAVTDPRRRR